MMEIKSTDSVSDKNLFDILGMYCWERQCGACKLESEMTVDCLLMGVRDKLEGDLQG